MRASVAVFFVLAVVMASANPVFGAMDQAKELGYRLQPSDVISITVHNQPDLSTKTRVTKEGYITFPLLGKVMVQGMTVLEIEQELKKLLEADYLVTAQVLVFIEEYNIRQISVMGEVKNPGKYDLPSEKRLTLMQAIGMAGGFTKEGDIKNVAVMRVENGQQVIINVDTQDITVRGDKERDIFMEAGDVITVPRGFWQVSVLGQVNKPGKFDMPKEKSMTALEAVAMAEGFTKFADVTRVKVMRSEGSSKRTIVINVNDITDKDQKDKDIVLQSEDIIYVPESFF
jgi:polysaccharide export outer membrane protein